MAKKKRRGARGRKKGRREDRGGPRAAERTVAEKKDAAEQGPTASPSLTAEVVRARRRHIWRTTAIGLGVAALLLPITDWIGATDHGRNLTLATYDWLHGHLSDSAPDVVVGDITGVPISVGEDGRVITSRERLTEIVTALGDAGAVCVGIDIDLSPKDGDFYTPRDREFFASCTSLAAGSAEQTAVPVFLGVHRTRELQPAEWLGDESFVSLAVNVLVPKSDNRVMPAWFRKEGVPRTLPSMGTALATAHLGRDPFRHTYPEWFAHSIVEEGPRGALDYTVARFLVNYRPVDRMVRDRVRLSDAAGVTGNAHRFAGKIVLLGTADPEDAQENSFVPPGYRRAYPGVYFHAAAANTLLQRPVHELTHLGRLLLDFGLSVLVFGAMAGIQIFYSGRSLAGLRVHRLERIVSAAGMVAAFVIGVLWVDRTRVMWDDYLIVFVAALVHRHVEPLYHALRRGWRRVAFRAAGETET